MNLSTTGLTLAVDSAIDLQLHTIYSDGRWADEHLLDYLIAEKFTLAAITDHDRVDIARRLQKRAADKHFSPAGGRRRGAGQGVWTGWWKRPLAHRRLLKRIAPHPKQGE